MPWRILVRALTLYTHCSFFRNYCNPETKKRCWCCCSYLINLKYQDFIGTWDLVVILFYFFSEAAALKFPSFWHKFPSEGRWRGQVLAELVPSEQKGSSWLQSYDKGGLRILGTKLEISLPLFSNPLLCLSLIFFNAPYFSLLYFTKQLK